MYRNRKFKLEEGLELYDETDGSYITIDSIDPWSHTAYCTVLEPHWDEDADWDAEPTWVEDTRLFGLRELQHLPLVDKDTGLVVR